MSTEASLRAGRWCAVVAAAVTGAAVVVAVTAAAPGRWPLVAVMVAALAWGTGGTMAVALTPVTARRTRRTRRIRRGVDETTPLPRIGVVMQLGGVPDEVARTTSAIAAASGPVALVLPPGRTAPHALDPAVMVVGHDDGPPDALAALRGRCDAVLFVSARAMPAAGCREAARELADGAAWVQGNAEPLNRDRFGPDRRELLDTRLRRRATAAGLWCWEPDATVVRMSLLDEHPLPPGRPFGAWLRARAHDGAVGTTVAAPIARRAAPVAADGYWPDTNARQRAAAADLSDAATSPRSGPRARAVAAALLVRALSGWSTVLWLAALVLLAGGSPVRRAEATLVGLVAASVVLRWLAPHLATGTRPAPVADVVAALYAVPGSLAATTSAWSRRVRPSRRPVPTRPLVWMGLVATAAAASVVLTARPGDGVARVAAGIAAGLLVLLWVFTVRSLVERSWRRVGFRIPLDLPALVDGSDASRTALWRLVDGSPGGFAVLGPDTGLARGDEITVRVPRADATELVLDGTVAARRHGGHDALLLGVELRSVSPGTAAWAEALLDGASGPAPATAVPLVDEQADRGGWRQRAERVAMGLVVVASVAVVATLVLVLAGVRPLVVRSGSMEPTYSVGDIVLVASEPAGDLRPGQVVTRFDAPQAMDSLTHRVQDVAPDGNAVQVTTKGDANDNTEVWTVPDSRQVGVVVASVPALGLPLTALRTSTGWALLAGAVLLVVAVALLRPRRRARTGTAPADGSLKPSTELPTASTNAISGESP